MTQDLISPSSISSIGEASSAMLNLSNDINVFKEKLSSAQALNEENVNFLLNNFLNRLKNKNFLTQEEKEIFSSYLSDKEYLNDSSGPQELSSADQAILNNLNAKIKDKSAHIESLNSSIVENQQKLIDEEASIVFLEKNNVSCLNAESEHIDSFEIDETLGSISELNNQIEEKYKIEKDVKLYLNPDSFMNKIKTSTSSSPASIKALQQFVSNYSNKENILSDLTKLDSYLATMATLEESSKEAQERLDQKQTAIDMLISAITESKEQVQKNEKELKLVLSERTKLFGSQEKVQVDFSLVYSSVKEHSIQILESLPSAPQEVQSIVYKLFGAEASTKIKALLNTYNAISNEIEKGVVQLSSLEESFLDFSSSLNFKQKRLTAEDKTFSSEFNETLALTINSAIAWLNRVQEHYDTFSSNAFDSSVEDYFEENLTKNLNIFTLSEFDSLIAQVEKAKEEMKNSAPALKKTLTM